MIETNLNLFDATVIGILLLSCLFAFFRGFVREVLSLGAWIGAAIVTLYYFPEISEYLRPYFKSPVVAAGVATLGTYILALMGFSLINMFILKFMKQGSDVGMLDNLFGLLFGAFRGAFIVSLGFFLLSITMPEDEYPEWVKESITHPYVERGAIMLARVAPDYLREISSLEGREAQPIDYSREPDRGYNRTTSRQLDRLIENSEPAR